MIETLVGWNSLVEPRTLPNNRVAAIIPLTFGRARIVAFDVADLSMYRDGW
jgi:hypothetical protein